MIVSILYSRTSGNCTDSLDEQRVSNIVSSITYDGENTWWKQTFCGKHVVFDPGND